MTARGIYAMAPKKKKPENPSNLIVAATFERAKTHVFAES
jgi:hypothetical protein